MIKYLSGFVFLLLNSVCFSQSGDWTRLQPPASPPARAGHSMAEIGEGKALLFGGCDTNGTAMNDTWIYDCSLNTWTQVTGSSKPTARSCQAMARIAPDKVLLFGGWNGGTRYGDTWLFNLEKMQWAKVNASNNPSPRRNCGMAQLYDGRVLLFGGEIAGAADTNDTWAFDLGELNWEETPVQGDMPPECSAMNFTQMYSGLVLMFGGRSGCSTINDTWLYSDNNKKWGEIARDNKPGPLHSSSMAKLGEDMAAFWGGCIEGTDYDRMLLFDLKDSSWVQLEGPGRPSGRFMHSIVNVGDGRLLMFGGFDGEWPFMNNETWLFTLEPNIVEEESVQTLKSIVVTDGNAIRVSDEGESRAAVYDIYGNEALPAGIETGDGLTVIRVDNFANGVYLLVLRNREHNRVYKVILNR